MNPFAENGREDFASYNFGDDSGGVDTSGFGAPSGWEGLEAENEANHAMYLQRQIEQKQKNILESSNRSVGLVYESEDIGNETAHELVRQGEQLRRTEQKLDKIDSDLTTSQRHITNIKSMFGGIRNYFSKRPEEPQPVPIRESKLKSQLGGMPGGGGGEESEERERQRQEDHPGMRNYNMRNQTPTTQQSSMAEFDSKLDNNLDELSSGLSRLKGLAAGLGDELDDQNDDLERIAGKAGKVDNKMEKTNTDVKRLLRR